MKPTESSQLDVQPLNSKVSIITTVIKAKPFLLRFNVLNNVLSCRRQPTLHRVLKGKQLIFNIYLTI